MVLVIHDAKSLAKAEYDKFMCSLNWTLDEQLPGIIDEYESHRKGVCSGLEPAKGQATVETDGKVGAVTKENSVQPKRKTREDVRTKVANTTGPKDALKMSSYFPNFFSRRYVTSRGQAGFP